MTSVRVPATRHLLRQPLANPRPCQRRWARVSPVRFLATQGTEERILAKYREKLQSKAKQEGLNDVSELKEVYKDKIQDLRKKAAVPGATAPLEPQPTDAPKSTPFQPPPPPPSSSSTAPQASSPGAPPPGVKTLSSFLDLPKVLTLPPEEITQIWRLRHAHNPQSLHFSLPSSTFSTLLQTAKKHPQFILPLPRPDPSSPVDPETNAPTQTAAEIHFLQWTHPHPDTTTLLFTHLAEFKLRGEFASPHTTVTFHQELAGTKGLVLGQGIVVDGRGVTVDEAKWLVMCLQKFYGTQAKESGERKRLLEMFTKGDGEFKVEALLEEAEKIV